MLFTLQRGRELGNYKKFGTLKREQHTAILLGDRMFWTGDYRFSTLPEDEDSIRLPRKKDQRRFTFPNPP